MESFFVEIAGNRFHINKYGAGDRVLLCFHGYGESAAHFSFLEPLLGRDYTLFAFDMPFHGGTEWKGKLLFEVAELIGLINQVLNSNTTKFSMLGYSMGGRVALRLLQEVPARIERVVLVAPDGFHKNPWQRFSTQTVVGNKLFKFTMDHPRWLFGLMKWAFRLNLLSTSIEKFIRYYLDDADQREILYKRWTTMRRFRPSLPELKKQLAFHDVGMDLFFGKYDKVIVAKWGHQFAAGITKKVRIQEIEAGHQLLHPKYASVLVAPFIGE